MLFMQDSSRHTKNYLPKLSRMPRSRTPSQGEKVFVPPSTSGG